MPYGMYISAAGALAQSQRLEVITNNLANVDTPGFKRDFAILQAEHSHDIQQGLEVAGSKSVNDIGGGVAVAITLTDFSDGILKPTGVDSDLAIDGEGFFKVERDGKELLTRSGNFHFSSDGRLLTHQGDRVLAADGSGVTINSTLPWHLLENGVIEQQGERIPLAIVKPQSIGDLVKVGTNYFLPLAETVPAGPDTRVLSGYIESSAVRPAEEMMQMIEAQRAYEANVKLIQNQDSMIGSLVTRILRQS